MSAEATKFRNSVFFIVSFTILLWVVKALEWAVALDFGFLGILPRTLSGTMGIITAPLVHGDVLHLISNTFPLLLLGISVFYFYNRIALEVFAWIYFMSGFWVWMAARDAYHIGASGIVYGLVAFLFFSGLFRRDTKSLSISLVVIFLYGGMLQGLFPTNDRISWESHLLGALAGAFCAFFYREVKLQENVPETAQATDHDFQPAMIPHERGGPSYGGPSYGSPSPELAKAGASSNWDSLPSRSYALYQQAVDTYPLKNGAKSQQLPSGGKQAHIPTIEGKAKQRHYIYISSGPSSTRKNPAFYIVELPHTITRWERSSTAG
jgi:membrane associated rhomboid family serine protease